MKKKLVIILLVIIVLIAVGGGIYYYLVHKTPDNTIILNSNLSSDDNQMISSEKVYFQNRESDLQMVGIIYRPIDFNKDEKYPTIIVTGPMLSVKEQTQSIYAERLAKEGYVTLVFDYTYFGESEGEPRGLELPDNKAIDISSAVDYLETLDYIDKERIAGIGICGSGSYMPYAATKDDRIKAVALVVPATTMDTFIYEPLDEVREDREAYERGEAEPTYIDLMPRSFAEGAAYYYNEERGYRNNWSNLAVSWSEEGFANFHPTEEIRNLKVPYIVITGENAWSKNGAEQLYQNANVEKEYYEIEGAGHFDMYDLDPYVSETINHIVDFFTKEL